MKSVNRWENVLQYVEKFRVAQAIKFNVMLESSV